MHCRPLTMVVLVRADDVTIHSIGKYKFSSVVYKQRPQKWTIGRKRVGFCTKKIIYKVGLSSEIVLKLCHDLFGQVKRETHLHIRTRLATVAKFNFTILCGLAPIEFFFLLSIEEFKSKIDSFGM